MVLNHHPCEHRAETDHNKVSALLALLVNNHMQRFSSTGWSFKGGSHHVQIKIVPLNVLMKREPKATNHIKISVLSDCSMIQTP